MQRVVQTPRRDWENRLERAGFGFHSIDENGQDCKGSGVFQYWREDVAYRFNEAQVERLYEVVAELHGLCMALAADLIQRGDLGRLGLSPFAQSLIESSWRAKAPHLYGRFDISWDGKGVPKMLVYNADTPTSIIETAVAQWLWKEDAHPQADQFNSLHEALVARWGTVARHYNVSNIYLAGQLDSGEDAGNLEYLLDTVLQAELGGRILDMGEISLDRNNQFITPEGAPIRACFKLYPWEWMADEPFALHVPDAHTAWIEPAWKMTLSNKAMLALLWEQNRGHPYLLETTFDPARLKTNSYVKKPFLSREGANVSFFSNGTPTVAADDGPYGKEGYIYQALASLPSFSAPETTSRHGPQSAMHAVIGAWVVGDEPSGICVREDVSPVTRNTSYFVPHYF